MFLDVSDLNDRQTEVVLEHLCKAVHDDGGFGIWGQHESPYIRKLIELFTERGLDRLDGFVDEAVKWLSGAQHKASTVPVTPPGMMRRWSESELGLVRLYLEHLPPGSWRLSDYEMLVEWMVQRYLPEEALRAEAEWLATKATLMGRVQANMQALSADDAEKVLAALPGSVHKAVGMFAFTPAQQATLEFSAARAAQYVVDLSDGVRSKMRAVITQHAERVALGIPPTGQPALQTVLMDQFGALNRDWRRIAVTEAGHCANTGFIASQKVGARVKRVEQYKNACAFCRRIDGRVLTVVSPDKADKDPDTEVWVGKDNYGRSGSPMKRVQGQLVPREDHELWQIPAGLVHPHCRGRWVPQIEDQPGDDPEFADWLRKTLSGGK